MSAEPAPEVSADGPPDEPHDGDTAVGPSPAPAPAGLNPNASSFSFNPNASSFEFKPTAPPETQEPQPETLVHKVPSPYSSPLQQATLQGANGLGIRRLPSVSEDAAEEPSAVPPSKSDGWEENAPADDEWQTDANSQWEGGEGEWDGEWNEEWNGQEWDENGYYDENGSFHEYNFEDYLDENGEYWMDNAPPGMLGGAPWPRRGGGHDRSHWHQNGTTSASTSPYTQATLQGANLQPWCGKLIFPSKNPSFDKEPGGVKKYDTNFLLQFQSKCNESPQEIPADILRSPAGMPGGHRMANTSFKAKHRHSSSDRSTLVLDGMAQRNDFFHQMDLIVPQKRKDDNVKTYDQEFLLQMQLSCSPSAIPGFELPDLPGVISKAGDGQSTSHPTPPSLVTPARSSRKSAKKPRGGSGPKVANRSQFPNSVFTDHPEQRSIRKSKGDSHKNQSSPWNKSAPLFTGPVEPLEQSQNRWVRPDKSTEDDMEVLRKDILSLLNKLTPEKFDKILAKFEQIKIDNKEKLTLVIESIFDKAVGEPAYAMMYAELCQRLSAATPQVEQHGETHTFKSRLLKKCYDNFMNEAEEEEPEIMEGENEEEVEERFNQSKKRMLGNITLIGELFKKGLLTENIVKICITLLLEESLEEPDCRDIEALCLLLTIVGSFCNAVYIESIMVQLSELVKSNLIPSRIRFMLEGVLDLKLAGWQPRREKTVTPKKLAEVHSPALSRTSSYQSPFAAKGGLKSNRTQTNPSSGSKGVMTLSRYNSFSDGHTAVMPDPNLLEALKIRRKGSRDGVLNDAEEINSTRDRGFSQWETPAPEGALQSTPQRARIDLQKVASTEKFNPSGFRAPQQVKAPDKATTKEAPMDASTFEKKVASILDEYLASSDEQEASECIQELKASDELLTTLPTVAVLHVMEKKATDRTKVDELIGHWCAKSILKEDHIIGGLTGLMEMLPDLEIDVPMYGKYLATTMGVIFSAKCIPGTAMKDIVGDMLGTPHAPKVLIWMFESIICTHSLAAAKKIYLETQMRGLDFIPGEDKGDGELDRWITKVCKCTSDMMWLFTPDPIEDLSIAP